jgi:hypothetical protein
MHHAYVVNWDVEDKVVPVQTIKVHWERRGTAPLILGTKWRWVLTLTPQPLLIPSKEMRYPLNRSLGRSQSRFWRFGEEKNLLSVPRIEPRDYPVRYLVLCCLLWIVMYVRGKVNGPVLVSSRWRLGYLRNMPFLCLYRGARALTFFPEDSEV